MVTCPGIIMVARKKKNKTFLPLNSIFEKTYAAIEADNTAIKVVITATKKLLKIALPKGKTLNNFS
jgi:hypothetical protein